MTLDETKLNAAIKCCRALAEQCGDRAPVVGVKIGTIDGRAVLLTLSAKPRDVLEAQTIAYEAYTDSP